MEYVTDALVLRGVDYKDNDKILTLFSAERGKFTAGIRGVRKNGAKLRFSAEPFAFCEYVIAEKGARRTVTGATLHDGFYSLRTDIEKYYAACSIAEVCSIVLPEGLPGGGFFIDAVNAVKNVAYADEKLALVDFLLSALDFSGFRLDLSSCGSCGGEIIPDQKAYFDFSSGRFSCETCRIGTRVSGCTLELLKARSGMAHEKELLTSEAPVRALRLLRTYFCGRTESDLPALGEYLKILSGN